MSVRVALLGNMNNGNFALARYLRDRGVDAHVLLYDNELEHFHPSSDTYDDRYRTYVHNLAWGSPWRYPLTSPTVIRRDLAEYDVLIGCGSAPAYLERAGLRLDVFVPFGGDIWTMLGRADGNPLRFAKYIPIMGAQAAGIRESRVFHMAPTNALYEAQWTKYRGSSERWYEAVPVVYDGDYRPDRFADLARRSSWTGKFQRVRDSADLLVFSSVRHFWDCEPAHPAAKGTDRLLKALAIVRDRRPGVRVILATFEYGRQVKESRALVRDLRLDDRVVWFPRMPRRDLMVGLGLADVACAEFENSWIASGVLYEALAMAKPVLAHRDDSLYGAMTDPLYPMLNAKAPLEIADQLERTLEDPEQSAKIGRDGRDWYRDHVVARPLARYESLIRAAGRRA